jgi:hypothetical protein
VTAATAAVGHAGSVFIQVSNSLRPAILWPELPHLSRHIPGRLTGKCVHPLSFSPSVLIDMCDPPRFCGELLILYSMDTRTSPFRLTIRFHTRTLSSRRPTMSKLGRSYCFGSTSWIWTRRRLSRVGNRSRMYVMVFPFLVFAGS